MESISSRLPPLTGGIAQGRNDMGWTGYTLLGLFGLAMVAFIYCNVRGVDWTKDTIYNDRDEPPGTGCGV